MQASATEARLLDVEASELEFRFLAGRLCLDLVATIGERWRRGFDRLRTPGDLARWAVASGLAATPPRVTAADLDALRALRGAIARVAVAWGSGTPPAGPDLDRVNDAAARPDVAPALTGRLELVTTPAPISAVASACARDLIDLIATGEPRRLRECSADDCSLLFYDDSVPGRRRWCSMAACGNRAKAAAHRARTDAQSVTERS